MASEVLGGFTDDELVSVPLSSLDGYTVGYPSRLVVWNPVCLDPSGGVFGRFDLAALCGCHTLNVRFFFCFAYWPMPICDAFLVDGADFNVLPRTINMDEERAL